MSLFGLFKEKVALDYFCSQKWQFLMLKDREVTWKALRDDLNDPAIRETTPPQFFNNMRGVFLQLLGVSVMKTQSINTSIQYGITMGRQVKKNVEISALYDKYNSAYGSSSADGILAMVPIFSEMVSNTGLKVETQERLYFEFVEVVRVMIDELKGIKLIS